MSSPTTPQSDKSSLSFAVVKRRRRRKKHAMPRYFLQKNLNDQYEEALDSVSKKVKRLRDEFSFKAMAANPKVQKGDYPKALHELLEATIQCYHSMRGPVISRYPIEVSHVYRQEIGEIYHREDFVAFLCTYVVQLYEKPRKTSSERKVLDNCLNLLLDYTNFSETVVDDIMDNEGMVDLMQRAVKNPAFADNEPKMFVWILYLLWNCARVPEHKRLMREKYSGHIYVLVNNRMVKGAPLMAALGVLAYVMTEDKAKLFETYTEPIKYVVNKLGDSLNNYRPFMGRTLESGGWSCMELGEIICQLARNDVNKRLLVREGALPRLLALAALDDVEQQSVALHALWNLSFLEENQAKMADSLELMKMVVDCYKMRELQRAASGILWNLRRHMEGRPHFQRILARVKEDQKDAAYYESDEDEAPLAALYGRRYLIKLSYELDNEALVRKIKTQLARGSYHYRVLSSDEFQASTMHQVMEIVEKATVVIICISQKYQDSEACRAEAQHASRLNKAIPVVLERDYQQDGWVRDVMREVETNFKFDSQHRFESQMEGLLRTVQEKVTQASSPATSAMVLVASRTPQDAQQAGKLLDALDPPRLLNPELLEKVRSLEPRDVQEWVSQCRLPREKFFGMTGTKLAGWLKMKYEAPDFFYQSLGGKLGLSMDDGDAFRFSDALDALLQNPLLHEQLGGAKE